MEKNFNATMRACFIGYIVQAIVNNFVPLLFLTFRSQFGIPLSEITFLITINFGIQLLVDMLSAGFIDKIGYRASMIIAHLSAAAGLILLTILPFVLPDAFAGILISVFLYALGGGLLEVLVSPIVEACPTDNKEMAMSLLHSFYCWGHVGVVLLSTIYFYIFGTDKWMYLAILWAIIPILNMISFTRVPIATLVEDGEEGAKLKNLVTNNFFWIFMVMMLCAGASEQSVSQWASAFAEDALGVTKTVGDLAGPMLFAICMGSARAIFGKMGDKLNLRRFMFLSTLLCVVSYIIIGFSSSNIFAFAGCAICGFSVGIMWPGTFSLASANIRNGGTLMFAMFALAGDVGCSMGPTFAGFMSSAFSDNLRKGIAASICFPIVLAITLLLERSARHSQRDSKE